MPAPMSGSRRAQEGSPAKAQVPPHLKNNAILPLPWLLNLNVEVATKKQGERPDFFPDQPGSKSSPCRALPPWREVRSNKPHLALPIEHHCLNTVALGQHEL